MDQLEHVASRIGIPGEDPVKPEILGADGRVEVFPGRVFGIRGRIDRARADVAEAARHTDPVWPDQILGEIVVRILVVAHRVPVALRLGVEGGVGEQPQSDHACGFAVVGADRHVAATRTDLDTGIFVLVGKRVRRAVRPALVEPQSEALRIGAGCLLEAGLVDHPEILPPVVAAVLERRVRGDRLQKIERAERRDGHVIPEPVVAAGPDQPHVPALDLVGGQIDAVVHRLEVVFVGRRHAVRSTAGKLGLVQRPRCCQCSIGGAQQQRKDEQRAKGRLQTIGHGTPPTTPARSHSYPYADSKDSQRLPPRRWQVPHKSAHACSGL